MYHDFLADNDVWSIDFLTDSRFSAEAMHISLMVLKLARKRVETYFQALIIEIIETPNAAVFQESEKIKKSSLNTDSERIEIQEKMKGSYK